MTAAVAAVVVAVAVAACWAAAEAALGQPLPLHRVQKKELSSLK